MKLIEKIGNRDVTVQAPPSKAHTLRALVIASLADGESVIERPLLGNDQLDVIGCLKALGAGLQVSEDRVVVSGCGGAFEPRADELNVGESGVGTNFLTAAACLSSGPVTITGTGRIAERPVAELVSGLRQIGGRIEYLGREGFPPLKVAGGGLSGGTAEMRGDATSQYFSAVAIAAPMASGAVTLSCLGAMAERPYFDITLQMMSRFGVQAERLDAQRVRIPTVGAYVPSQVVVEGDYSSASFFFLAAAVCRSAVTVAGLPARTLQGDRRILDLLTSMGCAVSEEGGAVRVEGGPLRCITEDMGDTPDLVPPLAVAAAFAEGTSILRDVGRLRHKESDRVVVIVSELGKMGGLARCDGDSLIIEGGRQLHGAQIDPHNDHRIAMSFAVAGLATGGQVIEDEQCVGKSFPDFWDKLGAFEGRH